MNGIFVIVFVHIHMYFLSYHVIVWIDLNLIYEENIRVTDVWESREGVKSIIFNRLFNLNTYTCIFCA